MAQASTADTIQEFRVSEFIRLGFRKSEAKTLAEAKEANGYPLDIHRVRKCLTAGCTHTQAWRIFRSDA